MASAEELGLLFRIKADSAQAEANIKSFTNSLIKDVEKVGEEGLQSFGSLGKAMGDLAGPAGLAALAIGGLSAVVLEIGHKLLEVTEHAAEYGNAIFEATEKTGLSAETMSALQVAANQVGISLDQVTTGVRKFTLLMADAQAGNEKAEGSLKRLHVTSDDLNEGLIQVVKRISELKPGLEQNAAAADAFGKKFGAQLIPLINQFHGDLPGLIKSLKDMGLVMSDEDAKASHEFEVGMKQLGQQFDAIKRIIGTELLPVFNDMAKAMSEWLSDNKGQWKSWGESVASDIRYGRLQIEGLINDAKMLDLLTDPAKWSDFSNQSAILEQKAASLKAQLAANESGQWLSNSGNVNSQPDDLQAAREGKLPTNTGAYHPKEDDEAQKLAEEQAKAREEIAKRDADAQVEILQGQLNASLKLYENYAKTLGERFEKNRNAPEYKAALQGSFDAFKSEADKIIPLLDKAEKQVASLKSATGNELALQAQREQERLQRITDATQKIQDDRDKRIAEASKKRSDEDLKNAQQAGDQKIALHKAQNEQETAFLQVELDKRAITQQQYVAKIDQLQLELLKDERGRATDKNKQDLLDIAIGEQKLKIIHDQIMGESQLIEQIRAEGQAYLDSLEAEEKEKAKHELPGITPRPTPRDAKGNPLFGSNTSGDAFGQLQEKINGSLTGASQTAALAGIQALQSAFQGLGQAVGDAVESLVLYGKAGDSLKQFSAKMIAELAKMAAIQAIWETAQGLAMLAQAYFFPAPNLIKSAIGHFESAAVYGVLAAGAGLVGRGVAGNSFNQSTGSAAGSNSSSTTNSSGNNLSDGRIQYSGNTSANGQRVVDQKIMQVLGATHDAITTFNDKFGTASPGDVVRAGAGDASREIHAAHTSAMEDNPSATRKTLGAMGLVR